jgi:hypothetical protein
MKSKFILCLSFVLSGGLFGCSTIISHSAGIVVKEPEPQYTRKYPINGTVFFSNLDRQTNWEKEATSVPKPAFASVNVMPIIQDAFLKVLADAGLNLQPPRQLFINDRLEFILFRGTQEQHDIVKRVVEDLNTESIAIVKTTEP